jgi:hypothetical protein
MSSKNKIENKAAKQILSRVRERKKRDLGVAVRVTVVEPDAQPVGVEGVLLPGSKRRPRASLARAAGTRCREERGAGRREAQTFMRRCRVSAAGARQY